MPNTLLSIRKEIRRDRLLHLQYKTGRNAHPIQHRPGTPAHSTVRPSNAPTRLGSCWNFGERWRRKNQLDGDAAENDEWQRVAAAKTYLQAT